MNFDPSSGSDKLRLTLFLTPPHVCGYFPERMAATLFVDPRYRMTPTVYRLLLARGFRRSGVQVYRPYCGECQDCVPIRIPVESFKAGRSFRRVWNKNRDLTVTVSQALYSDERFQLYKSYIDSRHDDGPMADPSIDDFTSFLDCSWGTPHFVDFRLDGRLVMVATLDYMQDSLSAVYTYFDPALSRRSLGTYAILWEIAEARRLGRQWLYMGYWVETCRKMSYKSRFRPMEVYKEQQWELFER